MNVSRAVRRELERENARMGDTLRLRPQGEWPLRFPDGLIEVWQSRAFLVQVYQKRGGVQRLSVCRTGLVPDGSRWQDGITWNELQQLKRECGRGDTDAVEIYPRDRDVVDVANMRHLWLLDAPLDFAWRTTTEVVEPSQENATAK